MEMNILESFVSERALEDKHLVGMMHGWEIEIAGVFVSRVSREFQKIDE